MHVRGTAAGRFTRHALLPRPLLVFTLVVAVTSTAWTIASIIAGPIVLQLPGTIVTTSDPARPLAVALVAWTIVVAMSGWRGRRFDWSRFVRPGVLALLLALTTLIVGVSYATTAASGADAHGYVSQADRWLDRQLRIDQSWASSVPWPMARWTLNPLGYRPSNVEGGDWVLVPQYSPGLPLVMAVAKRLAGQEAMFWVVPLSGTILVLATFGIGRRLSSPSAGLIGAWLVATSPAFLFMLMAPMTDVPVAAAWAVAFYCLLIRQNGSAAAAGLAAGLAIAIRPNLVGCAAVLGLWYLVPAVRRGSDEARAALVQGLLFAAGAGAGTLFIAAFNGVLNGSPFISTYGVALAGTFGRDNFWPNLVRYTGWLVETQTPFVLAGAVALVLPWRPLWPSAGGRLVFVIMLLFGLGIWLPYLFYSVFDDWWYLRFVLASWPLLMVGCGAVAAAVARRGRLATVLTSMAVIGIGVYQLSLAVDRNVFTLWKEERRYVTVARHVRAMTGRNSAIFSMQHSGSIRYYGGRMSVRYDAMDAAWFDRAVDWLAERGVRSYLLVDDWEIPVIERTLGNQQVVERLKDPPLLHYRGTSQVYLFDLSEPRDPFVPPVSVVETYENTRSAEPATLAPLDLAPPATHQVSRPDPVR